MARKSKRSRRSPPATPAQGGTDRDKAIDALMSLLADHSFEQIGLAAHLQVLDNAGRLVVTVGAKVELKGAPASRTSYSHKLDLHGLLYGRGKLVTRPQGVLSWIHEPSAPGAATMSTR